MAEFIPCEGNLLDSAADALICPTNTVGVMGAGLARQFRDRFEGLEVDYRIACRSGAHTPAQLFHWTPAWGGPEVICLATKRHFRDRSRIGDVEAGLAALAAWMSDRVAPASVAISAVGCGLGGLSWERQVGPAVDRLLGDAPGVVRVYAPWPADREA